jgi:hypothetical protein
MFEKYKKVISNFPLVYKFLVRLRENIFGFSRKSYSQFGEDLVLSFFIWQSGIKNGFYVDVGSYDPKKFSNTNFYYKKGWRGINIDARPGSMDVFKKMRKRDINLEIGISNTGKELDFYIFKESVYNSFSKELADNYINNGVAFDKKVMVKTMRLEDVLDRYLPLDQKIDFMSIDAEGFDLEVLESNNWDKYMPSFVLVEDHNISFDKIQESKVCKFLMGKGYRLVSVAYVTLIFKFVPNKI